MEEFGPPEVLVLHELVDPVCGPGEVVIEVSFSSVTFVETQVRWGRAPHVSMLPRLPAVPGNGVAGLVVAVGPGVDKEVVGARVVSTTGGIGGYAGLVSVPADGLIPVPPELALRDAAALLADGRTAVGLLDRVAIEPGAMVLVEAAAGGVGSLLVQLVKRAGTFTAVSDQELAERGVTQVRGARLAPSELRGLTARALAGAATGALRPVIEQQVPLARAGDAHRAIENRATIGKTLLVP
jgi:NADPH:quinone reductase-like Zn-dependent oxidoreductase